MTLDQFALWLIWPASAAAAFGGWAYWLFVVPGILVAASRSLSGLRESS
jgi:hypothetical protein